MTRPILALCCAVLLVGCAKDNPLHCDSDDKCRPKIAVVFNNPTPYKMKAKVVASFEGADGTVYMSCKRKDRINGLDDSNRTDVCFGLGALTSMQLRNWPKVTKVHIEADISRDK